MPDPQRGDEGAPDGTATPEMTLSEEELVIDTELVEAGRARLVKRIEVETVTRTIQLRREVLHIEHLDSETGRDATHPERRDGAPDESAHTVIEDGPLAPGSLTEGTLEIVLMQEEALVTTELVPRERLWLTKRIATENRAIETELSSEHVDLEQRRPEDGRQQS